MVISGNTIYLTDNEGNFIEEHEPDRCAWAEINMCRGCPVCQYHDNHDDYEDDDYDDYHDDHDDYDDYDDDYDE